MCGDITIDEVLKRVINMLSTEVVLLISKRWVNSLTSDEDGYVRVMSKEKADLTTDRIAIAHYTNLLKIMSFDICDDTCMHYLRNYQEKFIESGEQNLPETWDITLEWLQEQWPI